MKKIGFFAPSLSLEKLTGIGNYSYRLISDIIKNFPKNSYYLLSRKPPIHIPDKRLNIVIEDNPLVSKLPNSLWFRYFSHKIINPLNLDVLFCLEPFTPLLVNTKKVIVVYDLVVYLHPDSMQTKTYINYKLFFKKAVLEADHIICISDSTANRLQTILGKRADFIIKPKTDIKPVNQPPIYNFPYILSVSTVEPRKNIETLIRAFINLKSTGNLESVKLVLVGKYGWKSKKIMKLIQSYKDEIIHTGYIDNQTLANLYTHAKLFVFPSIYEGFGIPVMEAKKAGCCVITSDIPELKEACGDGCIYIQPLLDQLQYAIDKFFKGEINCQYNKNEQSQENDIIQLRRILS